MVPRLGLPEGLLNRSLLNLKEQPDVLSTITQSVTPHDNLPADYWENGKGTRSVYEYELPMIAKVLKRSV